MNPFDPYFDAIGDRWLCAWLVAPGICWIQSRSPKFARKLSQISNSKLVARDHAGGYLRIYEFNRPISWAAKLIARYTKTTPTRSMPTNEAFPSLNPPLVRQKSSAMSSEGVEP